jgi:hypothetical protein
MILKRPPVTINEAPDAISFISIATYLPLLRWRDVVAFMRQSNAVERQLKQSAGVVRYSLAVDILRHKFWTYSVWSDREAVSDFVRAEPHATAVKRFESWAGEGAAFVEWQSAGSQLDWAEAMRRLEQPTFYYNKTSS